MCEVRERKKYDSWVFDVRAGHCLRLGRLGDGKLEWVSGGNRSFA